MLEEIEVFLEAGGFLITRIRADRCCCCFGIIRAD